jgi:inhibitor of cysteine peptidase
MDHKTLSLVSLTMVIFLATACNSSNHITLTAADKGSQVDVKVGGLIDISLESNPSTGYTWEAQDLDTTMFEQLDDPVFRSSNPNLIGSGGILTLTFKVLKAGTTSLTLVYHRPWETNVDPNDSFTVTLTVK